MKNNRLLLLLSLFLPATSCCLAEAAQEKPAHVKAVSPDGTKSMEVTIDSTEWHADIMELRCTPRKGRGAKDSKGAVLRVQEHGDWGADLNNLAWSPDSRYVSLVESHRLQGSPLVYRCESNKVEEVDVSAIHDAEPSNLKDLAGAAEPDYEGDQWSFCTYILKWNKNSTLKVHCKRRTDVGKVIDLNMIFDPDTKQCSDVELWINGRKQVLPPDQARKRVQGKEAAGVSSDSRAEASPPPVKKSFWKRLFGRWERRGQGMIVPRISSGQSR